MHSKLNFIGLDLGGTSVKAGIVRDGKIICLDHIKLDDRSIETTLNALSIACERILAQGNMKISDITAIGICAPGIIDAEHGIVKQTANFPLFINVPLAKMVTEKTSLPAFLINDGNAAVLGEWWASPLALEMKNVCLLTLGTGVGSGIIINGRILSGRMAAEIGHMIVDTSTGAIPCGCGQSGCLERYVSASGIIYITKQAIQHFIDAHTAILTPETKTYLSHICKDETIDAKYVFDHMKQNPNCVSQPALINEDQWKTLQIILTNIFEKVVEYLAITCLNTARILDTEIFYIGGGVSNAGTFLVDAVEKKYRELTWKFDLPQKPIIKLAEQGNNAGFIGAARAAYEMILNSRL